jgi:hypothetical protein
MIVYRSRTATQLERFTLSECKSTAYYKHWEYQSFAFVQAEPLAQHVGPVYPVPYSPLDHDFRC